MQNMYGSIFWFRESFVMKSKIRWLKQKQYFEIFNTPYIMEYHLILWKILFVDEKKYNFL